MKSVVRQNKETIEWVVIDGGSSDQTPQLLASLHQLDIPVTVVSEPDGGIYDAMNKGARLARGEYCLFLNSGDELFDTTALDKLTGYLGPDIIVCNGEVKGAPAPKQVERTWVDKELNRMFFFNRTLLHQSVLIQRSVFKRFGYYDSRFKIKGDHDFFTRVCLRPDVSILAVSVCLSRYYLDGISSIEKNGELFNRELRLIRKAHFPVYYRCVVTIGQAVKDVISHMRASIVRQ